MTEKGNQNPFRTVRLSKEKVVNLLMYNIFLNIVYKIPGLNLMVSSLLDCKKIRHINSITCEPEGKIWAPHGSCIIYTNSWIRKEDIAFLPCTFMYMEEDILAEYIHRNNYRIFYAHNLTVYHAEDASINSFKSTSLEKR